MRALLPLGGLVVIGLLFFTSTQAGVGVHGFAGGNAPVAVPVCAGDQAAEAAGGLALAAYNLLMLPYLWTGVWGTWALGWFDTPLPAIVPWAAVAAFVVVGFAGLGLLTKRKAIALAGVLAVLVVLPVYVLTAGGDSVGSQLQPRYLLPLIVLLCLLLVTAPPGSRTVRFTRLQTVAILERARDRESGGASGEYPSLRHGSRQQGFNLGCRRRVVVARDWRWGPWRCGSSAPLSFIGLLGGAVAATEAPGHRSVTMSRQLNVAPSAPWCRLRYSWVEMSLLSTQGVPVAASRTRATSGVGWAADCGGSTRRRCWRS